MSKVILFNVNYHTRTASPIETFLDVGHTLEVDLRVAAVHGSVLDAELLGQVVQGFDLGLQSPHGEEGGQVGRVGGDDDEAEQPPGGRHQSSRQRPRGLPSTCVGEVVV